MDIENKRINIEEIDRHIDYEFFKLTRNINEKLLECNQQLKNELIKERRFYYYGCIDILTDLQEWINKRYIERQNGHYI